MNDKKIGKSNKMQVQKLPTGIEGFDDVCRGGLPVSRSTLVSGTSGTGKTVFSLQYLHHLLRRQRQMCIRDRRK